MSSHSLNDPDPFLVELYFRDVKQHQKGLGLVYLYKFFDFFHRLDDLGGCLCVTEIHQDDFSAAIDDELDGGHLGAVWIYRKSNTKR